MVIWILCPNLWGARLFVYEPLPEVSGERVRFVREFPRPKVRTLLEDFRDPDDAEDIDERVENPEKEARVARSYCRYLAMKLDQANRQGLFRRLIVCAEPQFLKIFEAALTRRVEKRLMASIPLDLYEVNESDLMGYVQEVLRKAA